MSAQQAFPVISDTHIIDKKIILDEVHRVFSEELPPLFNVNEISFMHTVIKQPAGVMDIHHNGSMY